MNNCFSNFHEFFFWSWSFSLFSMLQILLCNWYFTRPFYISMSFTIFDTISLTLRINIDSRLILIVGHRCCILWNLKVDQISEAIAQSCSVKKLFLTISQNSQKTPVSEFLFDNVARLLKRNSDTGIFLWILWNLWGYFFIGHLRWLLLDFRKHKWHVDYFRKNFQSNGNFKIILFKSNEKVML